MTNSSEFWQVLQLSPVLQMAAQSLADPTADLYWPWVVLVEITTIMFTPPDSSPR